MNLLGNVLVARADLDTVDAENNEEQTRATLDVWVPPKQPWRLRGPFPYDREFNIYVRILSFMGWFDEVPRVMQTLSHDGRAFLIHVQETGI